MGVYKTIEDSEKFNEINNTVEANKRAKDIAIGILEDQKRKTIEDINRTRELNNAVMSGFNRGTEVTANAFGIPVSFDSNNTGSGLMNRNISDRLGSEAMRNRGFEIANYLDRQQEKGIPVEELSNYFNNLDPATKQAVIYAKKYLDNQKQNAMNNVNPGIVDNRETERINELNQNLLNIKSGSAANRRNSPITAGAAQIANQTSKIGNR